MEYGHEWIYDGPSGAAGSGRCVACGACDDDTDHRGECPARLRAALQASEARVVELEEAQGVGEAEYLAMRHRAHDAERRLEAKTALIGDEGE